MQGNYTLKIGDGLIRKKGIVTEHYGIYLGIHNGFEYVAENNFSTGVRIVTMNQFLDGGKLVRVRRFIGTKARRFIGTKAQRAEVIPFVKSKVGTPYDLFTYNCEHFANEVQYGKRESRQIQNAVGFGALALFFFTLFKIEE